jgi:sporulation protein YlmC with PRC-barrel domain
MLIPYDKVIDIPVMSLQTGAELAKTSNVLIDPRDLTIVAYELDGNNLDEHPSFLRPTDVRELSNLGFIVDSSDEFVGLNDVIKIQQVYDYHFTLNGIDVFDERKKKLGKVKSYTLDSASFSVQQLTVKRPLLRSLSDTELLINRSQVIEVNDTFIKVKSTSNKEPAKNTLREYANPFRSTNVQPEAIDFESRWTQGSD